MSDIDIKFTWWEFLLASPVIGWPGLILGAALGALAWRGRRVLGGAAGAIVGNVAWAQSCRALKQYSCANWPPGERAGSR
jgi:hypothetical protein